MLLIENNFIYENGKRGVNLASNGTSENHIGAATIRFNTIVSNDQSPIGINESLDDVSTSIYGNILIRTDGNSTFIYSLNTYSETHNIKSNTDIGFVNFSAHDFHITSSSSAVNAATGVIDFPSSDIDGDQRIANGVDCGADEIF